ncbi:MAG: hypothetical protein JWQ02_95 [Capsulimonas sp.]|nr:hypothetical protein [Capsulimonas sp.]
MCLAAFDLIEEALDAVQVTASEALVLPSAQYKIPTLVRKYGADAVERALSFVKTAAKISHTPTYFEAVSRVAVDGIDAGELLLLAESLDHPVILLATGDKRFLKAFANSETHADARDHLRRNVVCLEYVIRLIITRHGFEYVRDRIVPERECNTSMKTVFGSGRLATLENVLASLEYKLRELVEETGDLLLRDF